MAQGDRRERKGLREWQAHPFHRLRRRQGGRIPRLHATASWNISSALEPGANQITILTERLDVNEVGIGLMGVAAIYREH